jgi:hypothetical protein
MAQLPISYRDFWDLPRIFVVRHQGRFLLFDCRFDEVLEDYPDEYRIHILPDDAVVAAKYFGELLDSPQESPANSWDELVQLAGPPVSTVKCRQLRFDGATRCRTVDSDSIPLLPALL